MTVTTLRWGILGTGRIAGEFAAALAKAKHGRLVGVASRSPIAERAEAFEGAELYHGYETLLRAPDIDAVYIATPHPQHAEWAIRAAEAGKHVLCEKPIGMNAAEAEVIIDAARRNDVFLMEAFMYRAHPQTQAVVDLVRAGAIGEIRLIQAAFGYFKPFDGEARHFAQALGGGGILDVGCYPVSYARLIAGAASGRPFADPVKVQGAGHLGESGVDEWAVATLEFTGGLIAQVSTGVALAQENVVRIFGTAGRIEIPSPWFCSGKQGGRSVVRIVDLTGKATETVIETSEWLYGVEVDTVARYVEDRQAASPAMSWADTMGNMRVLDAWRSAIGLVYDVEKPGGRLSPLSGRSLTRDTASMMPMESMDNVAAPMSRLAMGTAGLLNYPQAAAVFDAFFEAGGTTFDTAAHYGTGRADALLGDWLRERGVRDQVAVIGKGAHSPHCFPEVVTTQLYESLERLNTDHIDVYFLHRDNPDVPVGEFVDVLNEHYRAGRIKVFGGSNWTLARMDEANAYAAKHGLEGFRVLSNQFSLAEMIEPVWAGCISASDAASVAWLKRTGTTLFGWSSQARGFFTDRGGRQKHDDPALVRSWYNEVNFARRDRAEWLARTYNTTVAAIALAYNLAQNFALFPLIGPVTVEELRSSLAALSTKLTHEEANWLLTGA